MSAIPTIEELEAEFRTSLAAAGVAVAPERKAAMFEAFIAYRELAAGLDDRMPYALEPAASWVPACPRDDAPAAGDYA